MRKLAILSLAVASAFAGAQVGSGSGGAIPDGNETTGIAGVLSSTIVLPSVLSIKSITLRGLNHTWCGDVVAQVTSPNAVTKTLFVRLGRTTPNAIGSPYGDSSNFGSDDPSPLTGRDYTFVGSGGGDLWAEATLKTGTQGLTAGTYNATGSGSAVATGLFSGPFAAGTWTLQVSDWGGGDTGSLGGWDIRYNAVPEPATLAVLGAGALALVRRRRK